MNLFFERVISRRDFLKRCSVLALGGTILSKVTKFGYAQQANLGLVRPQRALYYEKLQNERIKCLLCPRGCIVPEGGRGLCRVRENRKGEYYTLAHSNPCAVHIDPIEKKPLFHFLPGTTALSLATAGCNFTCKNCQNWDISQAKPDDTINFELSPEQVVNLALEYNTPTIAYTYTEPSIFYEYMLETAKIARKSGIRNMYHSNGSLNPEPAEQISQYLDGANIDLKGFTQKFYTEISQGFLKTVLSTLKILRKNRVHLEITNLVVPPFNDDLKTIKAMCEWIRDSLGVDVPLHFTRFYPQYKLKNLTPTLVRTLEKAREIAQKVGLEYVYIGNVPGHPAENTYCPKDGKLLVRRTGFSILENNIEDGRCKFCGEPIPGIWPTPHT